ncbi:unnamed protein product, partial [Thlaspi arvense]
MAGLPTGLNHENKRNKCAFSEERFNSDSKSVDLRESKLEKESNESVSKGTRIHATVVEEFIQKHRQAFKEGVAVSINAFKVKEYGGDYRTSLLPFKMELTRTSVIKPVCDFPKEFPEKYFCDFSEILDDKLDKNILIDVIGQVFSVGAKDDIQTRG